MLKIFLLGSLFLGSSFAAQIPRSSTVTARNQHQAREQEDASNQYITPEVSTLAEETLKTSGTPGLSVGVVQLDPNTKALKTEFGAWGAWTEDGNQTTPEILFNIGSCSKAFLSAAMGILMEDFAQGKNVTSLPPGISSFTWKTKVRELFPGDDSDWELMDEVATKYANIRDILSHVTGVPRHDYSYGPSDTVQTLVRHLRYLRPLYEFREQWFYNNQMYVLGSYIISTYAGKPFHEFVEERIFAPLNMTSTTYSGITAAASGRFSQSFTFYLNETRRIPFTFNTEALSEAIAGPGGIISNTVDMVKWIGMLLNNGTDPVTGATIIPPSAFTEVTTTRVIEDDTSILPGLSLIGYGLGWQKASFYGHEIIAHTGAIPGFQAIVTLLPSDGVGVVSVVNAGSPDPLFGVTFGILQELVAKSSPLTSPSAQGALKSAMQARSIFSGGNQELAMRKEKRASVSSPSLPLEAYRGTYSNPGYGNFTLCTPTDTSDYCNSTLSTFAKIFSDVPPSSQPALYGTWPRVWSSHIQVLSTGNETFLASFLNLYPNGFGKNTSPFYDGVTRGDILAQFDVQGGTVKGLAVFEDQEPVDLPGSPPYYGNLKGIAGVYYTKEG